MYKFSIYKFKKKTFLCTCRIFFEINRKIITICENDCTGLADTSTNSVITAQNMLSVINEQISAKPFYFGKYQVGNEHV